MISYPNLDPIAISLGPLHVRWYGLMYLLGFLAAWWLARRRASRPNSTWKPAEIDDLIFYAMLGVIVGGRLGWCAVYGFKDVLDNPLAIFRIWDGGMSFHGGLTGVLIATAFFAKRHKKRIADVFDFTAPLPGLGILFGRLGNFINGELWGKPTDVAWGFIVDPDKLHLSQTAEALQLCRRFDIDPCLMHVHASQLYEGLLEGLVVFVILWLFTSRPRPRLAPTGLFLVLYGVFRFAVEFVRVPDEHMGYLAWGWLTTGQVLSAPMVLIGIAVLAWAYSRREPSGNYRFGN